MATDKSFCHFSKDEEAVQLGALAQESVRLQGTDMS